jgi:hypothetical protein
MDSKALISDFIGGSLDREVRFIRVDVRMGHTFEYQIDGDELDAMIDAFLADPERRAA